MKQGCINPCLISPSLPQTQDRTPWLARKQTQSLPGQSSPHKKHRSCWIYAKQRRLGSGRFELGRNKHSTSDLLVCLFAFSGYMLRDNGPQPLEALHVCPHPRRICKEAKRKPPTPTVASMPTAGHLIALPSTWWLSMLSKTQTDRAQRIAGKALSPTRTEGETGVFLPTSVFE